ncbi:hypothetical protein NDU88_004042 [Pleurodeles waltl]|uniref:Uncharacterized protein n=1 Tax=Pleurodeles waltl TaxID=8319 RepID=A0AAV7UDU6_PLEWA|nr:hypothetical protein NDU88_004042 [Pleurodeles waltl]
MFGVPRANNAERNHEQRKTAACEHLRCACDAKEKLIGTHSGREYNIPDAPVEATYLCEHPWLIGRGEQ